MHVSLFSILAGTEKYAVFLGLTKNSIVVALHIIASVPGPTDELEMFFVFHTPEQQRRIVGSGGVSTTWNVLTSNLNNKTTCKNHEYLP